MFEKELQKLQNLYDDGVFDKAFYKNKIGSKNSLKDYDSFIQIPLT